MQAAETVVISQVATKSAASQLLTNVNENDKQCLTDPTGGSVTARYYYSMDGGCNYYH